MYYYCILLLYSIILEAHFNNKSAINKSSTKESDCTISVLVPILRISFIKRAIKSTTIRIYSFTISFNDIYNKYWVLTIIVNNQYTIFASHCAISLYPSSNASTHTVVRITLYGHDILALSSHKNTFNVFIRGHSRQRLES